jgi:hypothetical protein
MGTSPIHIKKIVILIGTSSPGNSNKMFRFKLVIQISHVDQYFSSDLIYQKLNRKIK